LATLARGLNYFSRWVKRLDFDSSGSLERTPPLSITTRSTSDPISVHLYPNLSTSVGLSTGRETPSHTIFIDSPPLHVGMYAVSSSESRIGGLTSPDAASAFTFGRNKLTARGPNRTTRCSLGSQPIRDRPPYYPLASGHGHRP